MLSFPGLELSLIKGSIAELVLAQRSAGPGRIFAGTMQVLRCHHVTHEPKLGFGDALLQVTYSTESIRGSGWA